MTPIGGIGAPSRKDRIDIRRDLGFSAPPFISGARIPTILIGDEFPHAKDVA
jgi:hypothetical protein